MNLVMLGGDLMAWDLAEQDTVYDQDYRMGWIRRAFDERYHLAMIISLRYQ